MTLAFPIAAGLTWFRLGRGWGNVGHSQVTLRFFGLLGMDLPGFFITPGVPPCTFVFYGERRRKLVEIYIFDVKNSLKDAERYTPEELSAHNAADPDRVLWILPGLSCLVCRWPMRKGMGWSGVSVISLVIISYQSQTKSD